MRFNLYRGDTLAYEGASFNHATGFLYRSQPYGVEPAHDVFAIQAALRNGFCALRDTGHTAIVQNPRYVVVGPSRQPLTRELHWLQAEHCAWEWNASANVEHFHAVLV
jgi:hypothetical protein